MRISTIDPLGLEFHGVFVTKTGAQKEPLAKVNKNPRSKDITLREKTE